MSKTWGTKPPSVNEGKEPLLEAAAQLGQRGGRIGGRARAEAMTAAERSESSRRAANIRWGKDSEERNRKREKQNRWIVKHDMVQQNTWMERSMRDKITAICLQQNWSKREYYEHAYEALVASLTPPLPSQDSTPNESSTPHHQDPPQPESEDGTSPA